MTLRPARYVAAAFAAAMMSSSVVIPVAAQPLPGTTCALFPADSIFNADISALPVNAQSATMTNMVGRKDQLIVDDACAKRAVAEFTYDRCLAHPHRARRFVLTQ